MSKIRVLLIEDNRFLRRGMTAMLNDQPDMDIRAASSVSTNGDTIKKAVTQRPQVLLLDIGLKNQSSLRISEQLKVPHKKVPTNKRRINEKVVNS